MDMYKLLWVYSSSDVCSVASDMHPFSRQGSEAFAALNITLEYLDSICREYCMCL
jgi:hypothetical protein